MINSGGRGRRPGQSDTRVKIKETAHRHFLVDGYYGTSMRSVAADAGVDVALVSYYFGSKRGLFAAAMSLSANPAGLVEAAVAGDISTLAARLLRSALAMWDDASAGSALRAVITAAVSDTDLNRFVSEAMSKELVAPVARQLDQPDAAQRAGVFSAQVAGLFFSRYVLNVEPIASMPVDEIVRILAPAMQHALTG